MPRKKKKNKKTGRRQEKQPPLNEPSLLEELEEGPPALKSKETRRQERISEILHNLDPLSGGKLTRVIPDFKARFIDGREGGHIPILEIRDELFRLSNPENKAKIMIVPKSEDYEDYYQSICRAFVQAVAPGSGPQVLVLQGILENVIGDAIDKSIDTADRGYLRYKPIGYPDRSPIRTKVRESYMWPDMKLSATYYRDYITRICFDNDNDAFAENWKQLEGMERLDEFVCTQGCLLSSVEWDTNKTLLDNILRRAREVAVGAHVAELSCWECGQKRTEYHCIKCETARYCSEECQTIHWHEAHKTTCRQIKKLNKLYGEGMNAILSAHSDPEAHESKYGIKPSPIDSTVACCGIEKAFLDDLARETGSGLQGPTMHFFYKNVSHVMHDGFWFHPVVPHDEIKVESRRAMEEDLFLVFWNGLNEAAEKAFVNIAAALMYNYEGSDGALDRVAFLEKVKSIHGEDLAPAWMKEAEQWLTIYPENKKESEVDLASLEREYKRRVFDQLRKKEFCERLTNQRQRASKNKSIP